MGVILEPIQNIINPYEMNHNPYEMNHNPNEMNLYLIDPEITSILLEQQKYINDHEEFLWFLTMITIYLSPIVILITKICSFYSL